MKTILFFGGKKKCFKCGIEKGLNDFYVNKMTKDGREGSCIKCRCEIAGKARQADPGKYKSKRKQQYAKHKTKTKIKNQLWRKKNPEKVQIITKRAHKKIYSTLKGKLNRNISRGIIHSLKKGLKNGRHWETLVNFTIDQLKTHLENLFKPGMTWKNYGTVWEIDHKIPIAVYNFDISEHIDFKLCWSLKNLQPLGVKENQSKNAKVGRQFQPSLMLGAG